MKKIIALLLAAVLSLCLLAGCGGGNAKTPAAQDAAPAAQSGGEVTWDDYINWLADTFGANSPDPEAYRALLAQAKSWDDIDPASPPWDKLFADDAFAASTWDEFVANGGVGTYNTDFADDALTGSGEPTGEPTGEPAP